MDTERTITLIYSILGIGTGIVSKYTTTVLSLGLAAALYLVSFLIIRLLAKDEEKKFSWYVTNSLVTFVLVWLITWIFLANL